MNSLRRVFRGPWWYNACMAGFVAVEAVSVVGLGVLDYRWAFWTLLGGYLIFPVIPLLVMIILPAPGERHE